MVREINLNFIEWRKEATNIHVTVADMIIDAMRASGREVKVARDF